MPSCARCSAPTARNSTSCARSSRRGSPWAPGWRCCPSRRSARAVQPVGQARGIPPQLRPTVFDRSSTRSRPTRDFDERDDMLALLLRSTYEDGTAMSRQDISDELLTLLGAGHETTASTLGWAFERLSRHPDVLAKLVEEDDEGGNEYRQATILELQREPHRDRLRRAARPGAALRARRMGYSARLFDYRDLATARQRRGVPESRAVRPAALRRHQAADGVGCRSAVAPGAASARPSPTSRWMWCCEPCCGTSSSRPTTPRTRRCTSAASPTRPRTAGASSCTAAPLGLLDFGALRQLPAGPREVAGVPAG